MINFLRQFFFDLFNCIQVSKPKSKTDSDLDYINNKFLFFSRFKLCIFLFLFIISIFFVYYNFDDYYDFLSSWLCFHCCGDDDKTNVLIQSFYGSDLLRKILFIKPSETPKSTFVTYTIEQLMQFNFGNSFKTLLYEKSLSVRRLYWRGDEAIPGVSRGYSYEVTAEQTRRFNSLILDRFNRNRLEIYKFKVQPSYQLIDKTTLPSVPEKAVECLKDNGMISNSETDPLVMTSFLASIVFKNGLVVPLFVGYDMNMETVKNIEARVFPHLLETSLVGGDMEHLAEEILETQSSVCNGCNDEERKSYFAKIANKVNYNITRLDFNVGFKFVRNLTNKEVMPYSIETIALINPVVTEEVFSVDLNDSRNFDEELKKFIKFFCIKYGSHYKAVGIDLTNIDYYFVSIFYCQYPNFEIFQVMKLNN